MSVRGFFVFVLLVLLVGAGGLTWLRCEGSPPELTAPETLLLGNAGGTLDLELRDAGSGLRSLSVTLSHPAGEEELLAREFPGSWLRGAAAAGEPVQVEVELRAPKLPPDARSGLLHIRARDWSWRDRLRGNEAALDIPFTVDRQKPRVSVFTGLTYVRRGGAGVVVYSVAEPTVRDGVLVADTFFPAYDLGDRRVAFYAIPTDAPESPAVRVLAVDLAGNETRAPWPVVVNERALPKANITLPQSFLENTVAELASAEGIDAADTVKAFDRVNTELRQRNEQQIHQVLADSAPERLWEGAFQQLANSQVTSRFAEQRSYFVDGKKVSQATHYGYDLASNAAAPVTAAAAGRVLFAENLGIYGNCVLLDHGLGLASLYGHLSRVDVSAGDRVERGQTLGLSGATGLAGGDHLHFAVLVGGVYVDPLEWWDPKWVASNVDARLAASSP